MKLLSYDIIGSPDPARKERKTIYLTQNNIDDIIFKEDTLYVINGEINKDEPTEIIIPKGSILKFNHDSYFGDNITLKLNNTFIDAGLEKIFDGTKVDGFMLNDEIPVEWFGAIGDGLTDDSQAINNCIKYSGNQTVLLGANCYYVEDTIMFTESNWNPDTFIGTRCEDKWPIDKPFICKGTIIGGPNLKNIIKFDMGTNTIYIENIKMLNEDSDGVAVYCFTSAKKFFIGKIQKADDGQGSSTPSSLTEPFSTPNGIAVHFDGSMSYHKVEFGTIQGFEYGIHITDNLTGYGNRVGMGKNVFEIGNFWEVVKPIYVNLTGNSYFNGNSFQLRSNVEKLSTENNDACVITILNNKNGDIINDLYVNCNYWESVGTRYITLKKVKNAVFTGHFSGADLINKSSGSGKVKQYDRIKTLQAPFLDNRIFDLDNCANIKFIEMCNAIPIEVFSQINSTRIELQNSTLIRTLTNQYLVQNSTVLFDKAIFLSEDGNNTVASNMNVSIIIEPNFRHLNQIEYENDLPAVGDRDNTKWYAIPISDHGDIIKYKVYIYDGTNWVGESTGTPDLYFAKQF